MGMCIFFFKNHRKLEKPEESDSNKALIDRTIISEKELEEIRYLKSLRETRNRVSVVPQTKTIIEDQFLEPLAEETGLESSKAANKLSKKDRRRLLRKMIVYGSEMEEEKEEGKQENLGSQENKENQ